MASSWEEYYGFKTDPFKGILEDASGNTVDIKSSSGGYGIGFGPGDLRKAQRQGWSALSILDYLKGPAGSGGVGTHESSQYFKDTDGKAAATPQEVINELRQDEALQNRMKTGWENSKDLSTNLDTLTGQYDTLSSNYDTLSGNYDTLSGRFDELAGQQQSNIESISANTASSANNQQAAVDAMNEAMKIRDPYSVTQNSALQIQGAQTPSNTAGTISAGLAGLSRGGKKFKNKTLNI